jgi:Tol biopolymer transport system component
MRLRSGIKYIVPIILLCLSIISCGGGTGENKDSNSSGPSNASGLSGINGLITFEEYRVNSLGASSLRLSKGEIIKSFKVLAGNQHSAHRHKSGKLVYFESCEPDSGKVIRRVSIYDEANSNNVEVSPCNNGFSLGLSVSRLSTARLSPDETKVAVAVKHRDNTREHFIYTTIIYDVNNKEEIIRHTGYADPAWLPDGRLLILPHDYPARFGIYVTDSNLLNPTRIDKNRVNKHVYDADVSPSGKQVTFIQNKQLYIMNIDGSGYKPLIQSRFAILAPTWSPDGRYIAYLFPRTSYNYPSFLSFYEVGSGESFEVSLEGQLSRTTSDPVMPLSWIE